MSAVSDYPLTIDIFDSLL